MDDSDYLNLRVSRHEDGCLKATDIDYPHTGYLDMGMGVAPGPTEPDCIEGSLSQSVDYTPLDKVKMVGSRGHPVNGHMPFHRFDDKSDNLQSHYDQVYDEIEVPAVMAPTLELPFPKSGRDGHPRVPVLTTISSQPTTHVGGGDPTPRGHTGCRWGVVLVAIGVIVALLSVAAGVIYFALTQRQPPVPPTSQPSLPPG